MKNSGLRRYALSTCVTATLLAGCSGSQPPTGAPGAPPQARALAARPDSANYDVVYSFGTPPDGGCPVASLIDVGGTLYGTTSAGGGYTSRSCTSSGNFDGTVFSVTPGGMEKVLHSFAGQSDGATPLAALIDVDGTLYSTTRSGGGQNTGGGTVFSITTSGREHVLHAFGPRKHDGGAPDAPLIAFKGNLYGATTIGGKTFSGGGTFFSLTTGGTEKVLHFFGGRRGAEVQSGLIDVAGVLYGTASTGGAHKKGAVFRITPTGREKVLHSFSGSPDGERPFASLIDVNGTLYGTTYYGGAYNNGGTVYSITTSGVEKVLYSFAGSPDGSSPNAGLIDVNGTLYGTTVKGGAYCPDSGGGCGTVFSLTTGGTEQVLHSFAGKPDGELPYAGLIEVDGTLYGTTKNGGTYQQGTVFALNP
jgi:uncharacterized repeat protein (TIGR03803 family)